MRKTAVGIRKLKDCLMQCFRRVKAGETVIATEHGKTAGQIVPVQDDLTSRLAKLAEAGVVEWNGQPDPSYQPKAVNRSQHFLSDLVSQDRV